MYSPLVGSREVVHFSATVTFSLRQSAWVLPSLQAGSIDPSAQHTHASKDKELQKEKLKLMQTSEILQWCICCSALQYCISYCWFSAGSAFFVLHRVLWGQCQTGFSKYWHCRGVTGDIPKLCLSHWWFCFLRDQSQVSWGSGIVRDSSVTALLLPKAWRNASLSLQPAGAREHGGLTRPQVLPWRTGSNVNLDDESEGLTEDFVVALETETRVQTVC